MRTSTQAATYKLRAANNNKIDARLIDTVHPGYYDSGYNDMRFGPAKSIMPVTLRNLSG